MVFLNSWGRQPTCSPLLPSHHLSPTCLRPGNTELHPATLPHPDRSKLPPTAYKALNVLTPFTSQSYLIPWSEALTTTRNIHCHSHFTFSLCLERCSLRHLHGLLLILQVSAPQRRTLITWYKAAACSLLSPLPLYSFMLLAWIYHNPKLSCWLYLFISVSPL